MNNLRRQCRPLFLLAAFVAVGCAKPQDDQSRLAEIDRRFQRGDYKYAITELNKYLKQYPESPQGWTTLGWAYLKTDKPDDAKRCFDKAISFDARWDNAYVGRGALYRRQGKLDLARTEYQKSIEIVPDNPEAYGSLLVIDLLQNRIADAVTHGEKAWALRKDLATIPANLSVAYHYAGKFTKRDQFYNHAQRLGYPQAKLQSLKQIFAGKIDLRR